MVNTINHLCYLLRSSQPELSYIIENIDQYYYDKRQPKTKYGVFQTDNNGGIRYRNLTPSKFPLKKIQERIHLILQKIELPDYAFGGTIGSNNILNAKQHVNNRYFFSADIKNFFPGITNQQVFKMFVRNKFSPTVSRILTQLTTYRGCLPQGPPTSPIISNLVFIETGEKLLTFLMDHDIVFTSFYDDLTFSSKHDFKLITPQLLKLIREGGFCLNHQKVHYKVNRPEVTGVIVYQNNLWPIKSMKERAKENSHVHSYIESIYYYS